MAASLHLPAKVEPLKKADAAYLTPTVFGSVTAVASNRWAILCREEMRYSQFNFQTAWIVPCVEGHNVKKNL